MTVAQRSRERERLHAELDQISYMLEHSTLEWWEREQLQDERAFVLLDLALIGGEYCESKKRVLKSIARLAGRLSSGFRETVKRLGQFWLTLAARVRPR